jgi:hypothetical protein
MGVVGIQLRRYLLRLSGCERNPGGRAEYFDPRSPDGPALHFASLKVHNFCSESKL